jgi:hypothetical protein
VTHTEHKNNHRVLHPKGTSDVHAPGNDWPKEKREYWKARAESDVTRRQMMSPTRTGLEAGKFSGITAAAITGVISTITNVQDVYNGEKSATEAAVDIAKDAGTAGVIAFGAGFAGGAITKALVDTGYAPFKAVAGAGIPIAAISMGIASYNDVVDFIQGEIDGAELAYNLGQNASGVAGAMAGAKGGAIVGATAGAVLGPAGIAVGGFCGAVVGGMVGYVVAVQAYAVVLDVASNAIDFVAENVEELRDRAIEIGQSVLDSVANTASDAVDGVKSAMNNFASTLRLPISFA